MIDIVDNASARGEIEAEIDRLHKLMMDLARLLDDRYPSGEDLASAVTLINSVPELAHLPALRGFAAGHPEIGNRPVMTSPVIVQGPGWARTSSRLYILARSDALGDPVRSDD